MIQFYKKLLSSKDPLSSKRFISINSFFLFAIIVICALFGLVIPDFYIYALVSLVIGESAMTLVSNNSSNKSTSSSKSTTKTETIENGKETSQQI